MTGAGWATLTYTRWRTAAVPAAATVAWMETKSTRRNSAALTGFGCGVPTRCTMVAARGIRSAKLDASSALPLTGTAPLGSLASDPGRTSACTACDRASNASINGRPMYPVPPVMKTGSIGRSRAESRSAGSKLQRCHIRVVAPHALERRARIRLLLDEQELTLDVCDTGDETSKIDDAGAELRIGCRARPWRYCRCRAGAVRRRDRYARRAGRKGPRRPAASGRQRGCGSQSRCP